MANRPKLSVHPQATDTFIRIPRPQRVLDLSRPLVPTKSSLLEAHLQGESPTDTNTIGTKDASIPTTFDANKEPLQASFFPLQAINIKSSQKRPRDNLKSLENLGRFTQDTVEWAVQTRRGHSSLIMVKKLDRVVGIKEEKVLEQINHKNIIHLNYVLEDADSLFLGFEYCRVTLREILHVHLRLEELHLQYIARSIFGALIYLGGLGIVHHNVGLRTIRVVGHDLRVVLSGFDSATQNASMQYSNTDIVDLGFVLLDCMEGHPQSAEKKRVRYIEEQRAMNKVFGLSLPERWSGCKQLIDCLDDIFSENRPIDVKMLKPHQFFASQSQDAACLRPFVELVTLECYTQWVPGI
ncbi:hypothetical protein CC78DRAFT_588461 [Lojkania enalia]|uniref:Protein kinase domain-containing protein n=1 Tax=Lojkania enalia TaxID=147567 RepID=A0A9P4JVZ4_9PLEO|nr:hypothetical protein CC78DRAFT_588461 [Didymosphaeria enalia]